MGHGEESAGGRIGRRRVLRDAGLVGLGAAGIVLAAAGSEDAGPSGAGVLDVRDARFGAAGDGRADDRAAIQKALDAVGDRGGAVFLPPGDYAVGGPLAPRSRTLLCGVHTPRWIGGEAPESACRIVCREGFAGEGLIAPAQGTAAVTVRNLALVGAGRGDGVHGLRMPSGGGESSFCLQDVTIAGFSGSGIFGRLHVADLVNCFIHDNRGWGVEASGGAGWFDVHVANAYLFYNRQGNLLFDGPAVSGAVDFVNCRFERAGTDPRDVFSPRNPSAPGVRVTGAQLLSFTNCNTDANCGNGFELVGGGGTVRDVQLTSCRFQRDGTGVPGDSAGLVVRGARRVMAANCLVVEGKPDDEGRGDAVGPRYGVSVTGTAGFEWIGGSVTVGDPGRAYRLGEGNEATVIYDAARGYFTLPQARPAAPVEGATYVDAAAGRLFVWAGGTWRSVTLDP
ncbi:MAG TPA: glycosyl hydrolase family 28-related protein [Solirubrobacteraceae bacterium]|jgi:hypothetical protein